MSLRYTFVLTFIALATAQGTAFTRGSQRSLLQTTPTGDGPQATVGVLPALPYATNALEPYIDNATTAIHWSRHFQTYVTNLKYLVGNNTQLANLTLAALQTVAGTSILNGTASTTLINNGGGAWNHAFFFKQLTPGGTPQADYNTAASAALKTAINSAFGNYTAFQTRFTAAATGVFGSGFAWLIVTERGTGTLNITTTPNQNNPLQLALANSTKTTPGIPVLGIDVWEHAYYLKYQNLRPDYIAAFYSVINWAQISQNYNYAAYGTVPATAASPLLTATA